MGRPVAPPARHRTAAEVPIRHMPPGFRFHPTDEELVVQYLLRKALSWPLPAAVIPVVDDVAKIDPWDIPGASAGEAYFFSLRQALASGQRRWRAGSGYWKATGKEKPVCLQGSGCGGGGRKLQVVGVKTALTFHRGKPSSSRTDWVMHEYRLAPVIEEKRSASNNCMPESGEWAVCRVFLKNGARRTTIEDQTPGCNRAAVVHYSAQHREDAGLHQPLLSPFQSKKKSACSSQ